MRNRNLLKSVEDEVKSVRVAIDELFDHVDNTKVVFANDELTWSHMLMICAVASSAAEAFSVLDYTDLNVGIYSNKELDND